MLTIEFDRDWAGKVYRTRNQGGASRDVRFMANADVATPERIYRANVYHCFGNEVVVVLHHNGRKLPENHKQDIRAAVEAAYRGEFGHVRPCGPLEFN